ncbi:MAG: response regulator [Planctomycetia bacterium]|nr:response regulator [Planctomycetia bacterium]
MNTLDELRKMAEKVLERQPRKLNADEWGGNFKKLLEEISIYQIELEHQNRELERSEKLLAAANEEYVKLFESTPVGYAILDENRHIIKINRTFVNTFVSEQLKVHQMEGRCFDEFMSSEYRNAFTVFCIMAQTRTTPIPMELKLLDRHSASRYVMLTARVYDMEKKTIALTASDISMQKAMEEQLVKAKNEEENANRQKSRFLTNVSQELRSPIAAIVGCKEILSDSEISDEEKLKCCVEVTGICDLLQDFADRILDAAALESGSTPILSQAVDMKKICNNAARVFTRRLAQKSVGLVVKAEDVPMLWTDPLRLNQIINSVLEHVVRNAFSGEVALCCSYVPGFDNYGTLRLSFAGNDIFSSEIDQNQQRDYVPAEADHDSINIFMTKRIVNALRGEMIWEHPLNALRIEIPAVLLPQGRKSSSESAETPTRSVLSSAQSKTCLLVDDVAMNLKILSTMMRKLGYSPTLALSGGEARTLTNQHHFDLVLTDLWMPEINGEDLAIALRQNPDYDDVPIYAITADVEFGSNFDMSFFTGTIIKPINLENLRKIITADEEKRIHC